MSQPVDIIQDYQDLESDETATIDEPIVYKLRKRSLEGLGQGNLLGKRSMEGLGHGNLLGKRSSIERRRHRSLEGLGQGNILGFR